MSDSKTSTEMEEMNKKIDELQESQKTIEELMKKIEDGTMEPADEEKIKEMESQLKKGGRKTRKQRKQRKQKAGKSKKQQKQKSKKLVR